MTDLSEKSLVADLKLHWALPDVLAERCVHSRMETATCRQCVETCPKNAWVIDDERLGIDAEACDGCGLCAPACPEQAIVNEYFPQVRTWNDDAVAFAACDFASVANDSFRVPCVHVIGLAELARLRRQGVGRLMVTRGDCKTCARNLEDSLDSRVVNLNRLLADRGLNPFTLVDVPSSHWQGLLRMTQAGGSLGPSMDRRSFLRKGFAQAVDKGIDQVGLVSSAERAEDLPADAVGRMIPRRRETDRSLFAPSIDEALCNGCDACASICAHQAILLEDSAYRIQPDNCTGCRACVDICSTSAISIGSFAQPTQLTVPLTRAICFSCGADFHMPAPKDEEAREQSLCPICRSTDHQKMLFQVLD